MHTTALSRIVVAVAALAVGSVSLSAAPATAAPSEVTRDEVLAVAAAVRAETPTSSPGAYSAGTLQAIQQLAGRACSIEQEAGRYVYGVQAFSVQQGQGADGLVVRASIRNTAGSVHQCEFGALATSAGSSALSGSARLSSAPSGTPLAGDVTVTAINLADYGNPGNFPTLQANGQSVQSVNVVTSTKVSTPKTSKQKKYAKKKYVKRIKAAKKSYAKALKKAGSTRAKTIAKKAYKSKRATAKVKYKKAIAKHKIVTRTSVRTTASPFNLTASSNP
jgi:hypothetical protein